MEVKRKMETKNKVILIVDDTADDRLVTRLALEKHGFSILEADNWLDAITIVGSKDIDLIVLDLKMPEMDGAQLLDIIRDKNTDKELPIIIYTSVSNLDEHDALLKGSNALVSKNSDPKVLLSKIEEIFSVL